MRSCCTHDNIGRGVCELSVLTAQFFSKYKIQGHIYIYFRKKYYDVFGTDGVTLVWGTLWDVIYHRKLITLPGLEEEVKSAYAAILMTKQQLTVLINACKLMTATLSTSYSYRGQR